MAQINTKTRSIRTHEGAPAKRIGDEAQLRRSVLACLLWEKQFYENGQDIAERIVEGVRGVSPAKVAELAVEARTTFKLRHAPLLLTATMAYVHRTPAVADVIPQVVRRADELAELVAIHCHLNDVGPDRAKKVLSAGMKRGLARAFRNFDEYQLAKYDRGGAIKLRDVLFMAHPKPADKEQEQLWKRLAEGTLEKPDTWEVALSEGGDKAQEFERLLRGGKLGYMALLRNLRNMEQAGVDRGLVQRAILERKGAGNVLPFRFVAAARAAPAYEPQLDKALQASIAETEAFPGTTAVLVDCSISMNAALSQRSDMTRRDAAATLAAVLPGEDVRVFAFSNDLAEVPHRPGLAGVDAIRNGVRWGGTALGAAVQHINRNIPHDRLIVVTDEQSSDRVPDPSARHAYMVNVASYRNGVGYGPWTHIDGFSEAILRYIRAYESE